MLEQISLVLLYAGFTWFFLTSNIALAMWGGLGPGNGIDYRDTLTAIDAIADFIVTSLPKIVKLLIFNIPSGFMVLAGWLILRKPKAQVEPDVEKK